GYGAGSTCTASFVQSGTTYTGYGATIYIGYTSWLQDDGHFLFHEYGHAWSQYYAAMVNQDLSFHSYLVARGLADDPRVDSSYFWRPNEMIAEDYRELFGAPSGQGGQNNQDIPLAADVAGLREFLSGAFMRATTTAASPT